MSQNRCLSRDCLSGQGRNLLQFMPMMGLDEQATQFSEWVEEMEDPPLGNPGGMVTGSSVPMMPMVKRSGPTSGKKGRYSSNPRDMYLRRHWHPEWFSSNSAGFGRKIPGNPPWDSPPPTCLHQILLESGGDFLLPSRI